MESTLYVKWTPYIIDLVLLFVCTYKSIQEAATLTYVKSSSGLCKDWFTNARLHFIS